ncbi:MAG TPA: hypothetical protein VLT86_13595 [Vicinamibacterales bacterium]|nr:hypothetical protein [Vicinamibacterales bacterium]
MRRVVCAAAVMFASIAIASAQTKPAAPAAVDPCSLLTKDDAAAALGEAVTGPKSTNVPGRAAACEYTGSGLHKINLSLMFLDAPTASMYKAMCAQKTKDGLTGLGDTTCWYNDKHEELQVLKGTTFFSIQMRRSGDPTEAIKAAARKVYDRMK